MARKIVGRKLVARKLVRTAIIALGATVLLWTIDTAVFLAGTHHAWSLAPATLSPRDVSWWEARTGTLPPETEELIRPPSAARPRGTATWYRRSGGHGGDGPPLNWSPDGPQRLVAYDVEPNPLVAGIDPLIRGRVLNSSSGETGARVGVALPFVMHERIYFGPEDTQIPNPVDDAWDGRLVIPGAILNVLIATAILSAPFFRRDIAPVVWWMRGRCLHCGYDLRGHDHDRCPECGAP